MADSDKSVLEICRSEGCGFKSRRSRHHLYEVKKGEVMTVAERRIVPNGVRGKSRRSRIFRRVAQNTAATINEKKLLVAAAFSLSEKYAPGGVFCRRGAFLTRTRL